MAEADSSSSSSTLDTYWSDFKSFWVERVPSLKLYKKYILDRETPIPPWSASDLEAYIAVDPVHGPALKSAREAVKIAATGSAIGALSLGGISWKYSKSPHGALLALGAGAVFGWTFGQEVAGHWLQLYRLDTVTAQDKFLDWWIEKTEGTRS
ncbi:hypothetical protein Sjap_023013 [Stephania japonica]|uniref:Succinate dehydrogenase subunit 6, mitochondrial n=1 Tax=Stephania japonica TaxID=461633 RepID=A0AAP0HUY3_9MAGN